MILTPPQLSKWKPINPNWKFEIIKIKNDQSVDTNALKINYIKTENAWDYIEVEIDPNLLAIHRYLAIKVKGKVKILAKLFIDGNNQQDIEIAQSRNNDWNTLIFDMDLASQLKNNLDDVNKILLFIEPGTANIEGNIYIDEIRLLN